LKYTFPPNLIDPIYGGFTGALKNIAKRFKLNKQPTDIREEAAREVEVNVNNDNDNQIEMGKYKLPSNTNDDDHIDV
jgi:hypothetical protein